MKKLMLVVAAVTSAQAFAQTSVKLRVNTSGACIEPNSNYTPADVHLFHMDGSCDPAGPAVNVYDASLSLPTNTPPLASSPCTPAGTWSVDLDTTPIKPVYTQPFLGRNSPDGFILALRRSMQVVQGTWPWSAKVFWQPKLCYTPKPVSYFNRLTSFGPSPGNCLADPSGFRFWGFAGRCLPATWVLVATDTGSFFAPCSDSGTFTFGPLVTLYAPWLRGHFEAKHYSAPAGAELPPVDPSFSLTGPHAAEFATECGPANVTIPPAGPGLPTATLGQQFPAH